MLSLAALLLASTALAKDQVTILGDGNTWKVRHHGVNSRTFLGTNVDQSPCASVAAALESAELNHRAGFDTCFYNLDSEPRRLWAESLFNRWQSESKDYAHLIVHEAFATVDAGKGKRPNLAAVSVVPTGSDAQGAKFVAAPGSRPTAVLLTNVNSKWMLKAPRQGEPVLTFLTKESLREVNPDAYIQETIRRASEQFDANRQLGHQIGLIKQGGHPATLANAFREQAELQNKGVALTNWAAWKEYYNCQELNPPVAYDLRDAWTSDFSTPLSAQRSYRHALYAADGQTLHAHMDASARDAFAYGFGTNWINRTNYELFPKITKYTVLFTAATKFQGLEYASIFVRVQEANNPTSGRVAFESDIFVRIQGSYLKTADFDYSNLFGNPGQAARMEPIMLPRYPKFLELASKSEFPEYYYKIDE